MWQKIGWAHSRLKPESASQNTLLVHPKRNGLKNILSANAKFPFLDLI